ncbi:DUF1833 family protein [Rhodoplanes roseus]|uniref:DUF1833 domain-containing protein n=1 Tax=Rhodoplanes roseus TaxID=29409 RepID=A0A327L0V2_9BRAD|nr:DUF1833 family protein [Rhodoplanes roseus]RAI44700.1 hypothetical protein CH341_07740 [Rhodoplanes roseus]
MPLTDAIAEAYAAVPAGEVCHETLELDHVTLAEPIRVLCNGQDDIDLPLVLGGTPVTFTALGVSVIPPGVDDDGPTPMRVRLDLAADLLMGPLLAATAATEPFAVTWRVYTSADLTQPGEVISGLQLRVATLTATAAEATVSLPQVETQAFTLRTYDRESYPALAND